MSKTWRINTICYNGSDFSHQKHKLQHKLRYVVEMHSVDKVESRDIRIRTFNLNRYDYVSWRDGWAGRDGSLAGITPRAGQLGLERAWLGRSLAWKELCWLLVLPLTKPYSNSKCNSKPGKRTRQKNFTLIHLHLPNFNWPICQTLPHLLLLHTKSLSTQGIQANSSNSLSLRVPLSVLVDSQAYQHQPSRLPRLSIQPPCFSDNDIIFRAYDANDFNFPSAFCSNIIQTALQTVTHLHPPYILRLLSAFYNNHLSMMSGEAWLYLFAVLVNAVNLFLQVFFTIMYSDLEWYVGVMRDGGVLWSTNAFWVLLWSKGSWSF
jgi:hypothetical protein